MRTVIGEILPLALVVAVSPLNIIPAILLLFTARPLTTALSFLAGFTVGVAAVLAGLVAVAALVDRSASSGASSWVGGLKLGLGVYLLVAAVRKFRGRPKDGAQGSMPAWMDGMSGYSPGRSMGAGAVLGAANPKNIVVGVAAAVSISSGGLTTAQQVIVAAIYVVVGVLGVAAPIVVMLALGDRAPAVLEGWNGWLRQNNAAVMSVLFLVFGVVLIGQGIATV